MLSDPETPTASDAASPHAPGTASREPGSSPPENVEDGEQMRRTSQLGLVVPIPPVVRWKERDHFVRVCVKMGLNGPQIAKLSLSTPQEMRTHQQVYDKIQQLGLDRLYTSRKIERRRHGDHNKAIHDIFMKVCGQAMEYGYPVTDVFRDECPSPRTKLRVDVGMKIGSRLHLFEPQISPMERVRWHSRLDAYVRLYEALREPFRSNWLVVDLPTAKRVRGYAREVLVRRKHPALSLFNFIVLDAFRSEPDILKAPVWLPTWSDRPVSLM